MDAEISKQQIINAITNYLVKFDTDKLIKIYKDLRLMFPQNANSPHLKRAN